MRLDHVVLWTKDPLAALGFYTDVVGLAPVRADEFAAGQAPFPSVRVSDDCIIDLMPMAFAVFGASSAVAEGSTGHPVNHVCLAMSKDEYEALDRRLRDRGIDTGTRLSPTFGARGWGPEAYYFADPDGNVLEARYYD